MPRHKNGKRKKDRADLNKKAKSEKKKKQATKDHLRKIIASAKVQDKTLRDIQNPNNKTYPRPVKGNNADTDQRIASAFAEIKSLEKMTRQQPKEIFYTV